MTPAAEDAPADRFTPLTVALLAATIAMRVLSYLFQRFAGIRSGGGAGLEALRDPWFFGGVGWLLAASVVWPLVLRRLPLRRAYPFTALVPPLNLAVAALVVGETVTWRHAVAVGIIAAGVWIVAGRPRS